MSSLPESIVSMLRGECNCTNDWKEIADLGRTYYQEGKSGSPFDFPQMPQVFRADVVNVLKKFLRQCWEQGRQDAQRRPYCEDYPRFPAQ